MTKCVASAFASSDFGFRISSLHPHALWKQLLLSLYYNASYPARAWNRRRLAMQGRMPVIVLLLASDRR